jgi:hypothetical protein
MSEKAPRTKLSEKRERQRLSYGFLSYLVGMASGSREFLVSPLYSGTPELVLRTVDLTNQTLEFGFGFRTQASGEGHDIFSFLILSSDPATWSPHQVLLLPHIPLQPRPLDETPSEVLRTMYRKFDAVFRTPGLTYTQVPGLLPRQDLRVRRAGQFFYGEDAYPRYRDEIEGHFNRVRQGLTQYPSGSPLSKLTKMAQGAFQR